MQSPLTINTKPFNVKDWPNARKFLRDLNPTTVTVCVDQQDHFKYIQEVQADLPNAKIVARFIDEIHDGSMHMKPQTNNDKYIVSPANQLNRIRRYGQNGLSAYFGNEPSTKAPIDDLIRLADHIIEAMDLAATRDYDMSLTVGNFGIGHPQPIDGYLPTWMHPMLVKLNGHRGRHFYGLHTYLPMDILEHLKALKKTCDERLKIPMPRCIITEFAYDNEGTDGRSGFKSRGISAETFAAKCASVIQNEFKPWIESGVLLGVCTFIYGDDTSWHSFNVETSNNVGEVSTAWRDGILEAKRMGKLDVKPVTAPPVVIKPPIPVSDIVRGSIYRLNMSGKIITAVVDPAMPDRPVGTIPDNAVVEIGNKVTVKGDTWLQVAYPSFNGWGWIKSDLITIRSTMENPVIVLPVPELPTEPPKGVYIPMDTLTSLRASLVSTADTLRRESLRLAALSDDITGELAVWDEIIRKVLST